MKQCPIDFFDPEVQHLAASAGCRLYRMQNDTGEGLISEYPILSGIDLFYNDFHMKDGQNQNKRPMPDTIEINHCREGRFECEFQNGDYQYIGAGDLSIHRLSHTTRQTRFPLAHYHGISITIDLPRAQQTLSSLEAIMGDLDIHLEAIAERFCREELLCAAQQPGSRAHFLGAVCRPTGTDGTLPESQGTGTAHAPKRPTAGVLLGKAAVFLPQSGHGCPGDTRCNDTRSQSPLHIG